MSTSRLDSVPRIRIEPTLANDLSLMVQLLPISRELTAFVTDPRAFVQDHRAELRFLEQLARTQIKRLRRAEPEPAADEKKEQASLTDIAPPALVRRQMVMLR